MVITRNFLAMVLMVSITNAIPFSSSIDSYDLSRIKRSDPPINYRLPDNVIPISYKIKLNPDFDGENFTFYGESEINIDVKKPTNEIILHAKYLKIIPNIDLKCNINNNVAILSINYIHNMDFLKIILEKKLEEGFNCNLKLKYTGEDSDNLRGLYRASYYDKNGDEKWIASTYLEPIAARQVFPCWDEPAWKANFTISIEHSTKYIALSNMHVTSEDITAENSERIITHFAESPKMPTYIVAFAIGDFVLATDHNKNFRIWTVKDHPSNLNYAQETGPKLMAILENYTNFPYQTHGLNKIDSVVVLLPWETRAMENWGLITYKEHALVLKNTSSILKVERVTTTMAHELAHQWFGNLISPNSWDYIWLNEGFANYFQYAITDQMHPEWRMMEKFVTENMQMNAFLADSSTNSHPMEQVRNSRDDIEDAFDSITYAKSGSVIRMISYVIGEEKFKTGLRNYIKTKAFKSATSDDLFKEFAKVDTDNSNLPKILKNWVTSPGYPVITVKRDYDAGRAIITQSRFLKNITAMSNEKYWIPINFVTQDNLDFTNTSITHWFDPSMSSIEINQLKKDQFVIFNKQLFGYYRVNYDNQNWKLIINYLKNENHSHIHVLNRAQLLDDAFNLVQVDHLNYEIFLSLLGYLREETDFIPWSVAWRVIENIYNLVINTDLADDFKDFILKLSKKLENEVLSIQLDKVDSIMELKRSNTLEFTCKFGSSLCRSYATRRLLKWLEDPELNELSADEKIWIMCSGIQDSDEEIWNKLWEKYWNTRDISIWFALGCSLNNEILENFISKTMARTSTFRQLSTIFLSIQFNIENGISFILDYINNHYNKIIALNGYSIDKLKGNIFLFAEKIQNTVQRDKLKLFIENNNATLKGSFDDILAYVEYNSKIAEKQLHKFKLLFETNVTEESDTSIHIDSGN